MLFKVIRPFFFIVMRIFSWCVFLLTLISAYGGIVNPFLMTLPALLCLALPYLAILTILLTVFWIFNRKIILSALGVGTII